MKFVYSPGHCNYESPVTHHHQSRHNLAEVTVTLIDGRFSASGGIWMASKKDYLTCGQCLETIFEFFPNDKILQEIVSIWRLWHLNDMTAGSPRQEALLQSARRRDIPSDLQSNANHYDWAKQVLKDAGMDPDMEFFPNDKPYVYGSAWLTREIPEDVVARIHAIAHKVGNIKASA